MKNNVKKSKRDEIEKDCIKFWILDIYIAYKKKLMSVKGKPKIHHLAWFVYSQYIRLKKRIDHINCECITCGDVMPRYEIQAWHFIKQSRGLKHKFNDDNVWSQCMRCNVMLDWNYITYTRVMENKPEFWPQRVDMMNNDHESITIKNFEYAEMIQKRRGYSWPFVLAHNKTK